MKTKERIFKKFDELSEETGFHLDLVQRRWMHLAIDSVVNPTKLIELPGTGYLIKTGELTFYHQRFSPLTASEDPLNDFEEVITLLCEYILSNGVVMTDVDVDKFVTELRADKSLGINEDKKKIILKTIEKLTNG